MFKVLSIAGSDSSGGAGIQADLKTFSAHGVYGMTVITALTAQNTKGVYLVDNTNDDMVVKQIDAVFHDIFPDAIKIGMLSSPNIVKIVASRLTHYKAKNIVLDPVMVSTSGHSLISPEASKQIIQELFPIADIITPNLPEAEVLADMKILNEEDVMIAGEKLMKMTKGSVLIKGGHFEEEESVDYLFTNTGVKKFSLKRIDTKNSHGTGCTLSSAIASNLAQGLPMEESVKLAKSYVYGALLHDPQIGEGNGPLNHLWQMSK